MLLCVPTQLLGVYTCAHYRLLKKHGAGFLEAPSFGAPCFKQTQLFGYFTNAHQANGFSVALSIKLGCGARGKMRPPKGMMGCVEGIKY